MPATPRKQETTPDWGEDTIYCEATCAPEDVLYHGSDDEDYDSTNTRRLRYEAAGQRFLAGNAPCLLSASLRGPFNKESGWLNPWRSKLRTFQPSPSNLEGAASNSSREQLKSPARQVRTLLEISDSLECHLPSPESLKQATITGSHPYLEKDELAAVVDWRKKLPSSNKVHNESMWLPGPALPTTKKKRRESASDAYDSVNGKRRRMNRLFSTALLEGRGKLSPYRPSGLLVQKDSPSFSTSICLTQEKTDGASGPLGFVGSDPAAMLSSPTSLVEAASPFLHPLCSPTRNEMKNSSQQPSHQKSPSGKSILNRSKAAALDKLSCPESADDGELAETQRDDSFHYRLCLATDKEPIPRLRYAQLNKETPETTTRSISPDSWSGISESYNDIAEAKISISHVAATVTPVPAPHCQTRLARDQEPETQDFAAQEPNSNSVALSDANQENPGSSGAIDDERVPACSVESRLYDTSADCSISAINGDARISSPSQPKVQVDVEATDEWKTHHKAHSSEGNAATIMETRKDICGATVHKPFTTSDPIGCTADTIRNIETSSSDQDSLPHQDTENNNVADISAVLCKISPVGACLRSPKASASLTVSDGDKIEDVEVSMERSVDGAPSQAERSDSPAFTADPSVQTVGNPSLQENTESTTKSTPDTEPLLGRRQDQSPWVQSPKHTYSTSNLADRLLESTPSKFTVSSQPMPPDVQSLWAPGTESAQMIWKPTNLRSTANPVSISSSTERPSTPEPQFPVRSFASFMTPSPERLSRRKQIPWCNSGSNCCDSQGSLTSALRNPWDSSRPKRRVSWAVVPDEHSQIVAMETANLPIAGSQPRTQHTSNRAASPPPSVSVTELPTSGNSKFSKHFSAVADRDRGRGHVASLQEHESSHDVNTECVSENPTSVANSVILSGSAKGNCNTERGCRVDDDEDAELETPIDIVEDLFREIGDVLQTWDLDTELELAKDTKPPRTSQLDIGLFGQ
ncbi:hypothetical protein HJFPF1_00345 [Paramyrothecium foliicola]|nr:hypothetical protein HJFPF1_00345 [Paramyrothecium foliicola]